MAVIDVARKTVTLKIVYFGCAMGGKTTNLITLHRLTDPRQTNGLTSIATTSDRTLFFDLLPMDLGQIAGMQLKAKVYTVPGQVHYETTRRQVLGGTDGVVLVVDSSAAQKKSNAWALENLRYNLKANNLDPDKTPTVLQWNKRDLPDARPVSELQAELNQRKLPHHESIATTGAGVVETFETVLLQAILHAYAKSGRPIAEKGVRETLARSFAQSRAVPPSTGAAPEAFDHRFDMEAYRDQQVEEGHNRKIIDEASLLSESVKTNMKLAEKLDDYKKSHETSERRARMMQALATITPLLTDAAAEALPQGVMKTLLAGCDRQCGSMLLLPGRDKVLQEREVFPAGQDLLNTQIAPGLGSLAFRLCETPGIRVFDDLAAEVFFNAVPPEAVDLASAIFAPLSCDGTNFGACLVYSRIVDRPFDRVEQEYWRTATSLIALSLHWRAVRSRLTKTIAS